MAMERSGRADTIRHGKILPAESWQLASAIPVDNKVLWVNGKMRKHMPFKIVTGKPCDLGLFLTPEKIDDAHKMELMTNQMRSALLARVVFKDAEGRIWRDVNIKGGGASSKYSFDVLGQAERSNQDRSFGGMQGLMDEDYAKWDRDKSAYFLKRGLRTHRVIAIVEIYEVIDHEGKRVSVEEAKRRGMIPQDKKPVLQIRAFGTEARVINADDSRLLEDGKRLVGQELGKNEDSFSDEEYTKWFAKTLGEQVAIIHSNHHHHKYLNRHNITLDCKITDLDSIEELPSTGENQFVTNDLEQAKDTLLHLIAEMRRRQNIDLLISWHPDKLKWLSLENEIVKEFYRSYANKLSNPKVMKNWLLRDYLESHAEIELPKHWESG